MLNLAKSVEFSAEPDTSTNVLSFSLAVQLSKTKQNVKTVLVRLPFPINAHQNANQKPIGSAPSYQAQCTLPLRPMCQTLLFDFSRVWFRDYPFGGQSIFAYSNCTSPSNDYAGVACSNNNQASYTLTYYLTDLQTFD